MGALLSFLVAWSCHVVNHADFETILRTVKTSLQSCDDELFVLAIFCKRGEQRSVAACALVSVLLEAVCKLKPADDTPIHLCAPCWHSGLSLDIASDPRCVTEDETLMRKATDKWEKMP